MCHYIRVEESKEILYKYKAPEADTNSNRGVSITLKKLRIMINSILTHSTITLTADTPRIYCVCLASYNSGILHGQWISADQEADEIREEIENMLSESSLAEEDEPCEEWAIHDYENFEDITIDEYEDLEYISALAKALNEHGRAFSLYINCLGLDDIEEAVEKFNDNYRGCFEYSADYAEHFYEETGQLEAIENTGLRNYINWESIAHDWECGGSILALEESYNEIHIFHNL